MTITAAAICLSFTIFGTPIDPPMCYVPTTLSPTTSGSSPGKCEQAFTVIDGKITEICVVNRPTAPEPWN